MQNSYQQRLARKERDGSLASKSFSQMDRSFNRKRTNKRKNNRVGSPKNSSTRMALKKGMSDQSDKIFS
jgi:hypothetical protein